MTKMSAKQRALIVTAVACLALSLGCEALWHPLRGNNPRNCVINSGICGPTEVCDTVRELCIPAAGATDLGTPISCPGSPCPMGLLCNTATSLCEPPAMGLAISRLEPRTVPLTGMAQVTVRGIGFSAPAQVSFGSLLSPRVSFVSPSELTVEAPPATQVGLVRVEVTNMQMSRVFADGLFSYAYPIVDFANDPVLSTSSGAGPLIITDLNGDNRPDVAVAHTTRVSTFYGSGTGVQFRGFTENASTFSASSNGKFVAANLNNDSNGDLVLLDRAQGSVIVLHSNGSGGFTPTTLMLGMMSPNLRDLAVADVDGDQRQDLLVTKTSPDQLLVFSGDGNGLFSTTPRNTIGLGPEPCAVGVGRFDADTKPDVAVLQCSGTAEVRIYLNVGGMMLLAAPRGFALQAGTTTPKQLVVADMNIDQRLDLVVASADLGMNSVVSVLLGGGNGDFLPVINSQVGAPNQDLLAIADANGDALPDVFLATSSFTNSDGIRVMRGDGFGGLGAALNFQGPPTHQMGLRAIAAGDVTADGKADILYTANAFDVAFLRNGSR